MPVQKEGKISRSVIRRLPRYYRFLSDLEALGVTRISSHELSDRMGLTASQIRQDFNCFGGFGQQGYGYSVSELREAIAKILGLHTRNRTILIGAGNLGRALAAHIDFEKYGYDLIGMFDADSALSGKQFGTLTVQNISELGDFCAVHHPTAAVLCIPETAAQELADQLVRFGIRAFWNFSHYDLSVNHNCVIVENVHLGDSLMTLAYDIQQMTAKAPFQAPSNHVGGK